MTERPDVVERERPWMRPAGIAALIAVAAILIGSLVRSTALDGDSVSEQMLEAAAGDADGKLLLSALLSGLGFALCSFPLTFLFLAARNRSDRVLRQLIGLTVIGGLLIGAGQISSHFAFLDAADDFAAAEAERPAEPEAPPAEEAGEQAGQGAGDADTGGVGTTTERGAAAEGERETTVEATTEAEDGTTDTATTAEEREEEAEDEADDRAEDARDDASGASLSRLLGTVGGLAFAIGLFYTSLWAMRVGLLTRFWGTLGMAAAVVSTFLPPFFIVLLIWFGALGLLLLGIWYRGRPPAWEAGVAIPWPRPGEPPADGGPGDGGSGGGAPGGGGPGGAPGGDPGAVEGSGRELGGGQPEQPQAPAEPPRKRKRRG
jgi:hypothetical protein